jgi:hypothetical protein
MDKEKRITVNIINRNYPPNTGVIAECAAELVSYLITKGIKVNIIYIDPGAAWQRKFAEQPGTVYPIRGMHLGRSTLAHLLCNLYECFRLLRKSRSLNPDVTICITEPPLLSIAAAFFFGKRDKWILWSMDLFPEGFSVGDGMIVSQTSSIYKFVNRIVRKNKPSHIISLGNYQIKYLQEKFGAPMTFTKLPCGILSDNTAAEKIPAWASDRAKVILGYCGNCGDAHSDELVVSVVKMLDPEKYKIILAPYGMKAKRIIDFAKGKPGVEIVSYVERHELKYIDIHLASLKFEWVNILVPSKTVSAVCSGSAFLYFGSEQSDNWDLLKEAGWIVPSKNTSLENSLADFFADIEPHLNKKKAAAVKLLPQLQALKEGAFSDIHEQINKLHNRAYKTDTRRLIVAVAAVV